MRVSLVKANGVAMGSRPVRASVVLAMLLAVTGAIGCQAERPMNVVLFTFDTTRAEFLGCYGKDTARTPNLDRLAAGGVLFEQTAASNPVTQASHSTILTGTYPMAHGVRDNILFKLADERETLAEMLAGHGYATGAAIGGFPLVASFGSGQGFDYYDDDLDASREDARGRPAPRRQNTWYDERPAGHVNDAIRPWLREQIEKRPQQPFFIWLHYWDPHEPHIPPSPYNQLFAHDPYQGEIAYADQNLGEILHELEDAGELQRTLVVMTADHGEGRMEHEEMTHAFLAYETCLRVPLIFSGPELVAGRRITDRVGTVDIVPTILDLLGFAIPSQVQGRSLAPLLLSKTSELPPTSYYAESLSPRLTHGFGELRVLYRDGYKYIHGPRPELFYLEEDPVELHDLVAQEPVLREQMKSGLETIVANYSRPEDAATAAHEVDDDTRRRLEALGYISMTGDEAASSVAEVLSEDGAPPQDRVGDINLASQLRRQLAAGNFRLARQTALQLLEPVPDHDFYRGQLARALLGLGRVVEAAVVVDTSSRISGANLEPFLDVAEALFEGEQRQRGMEMAHRLTSAEPTVEGLLLVARMQSDEGDPNVDATLARALELDPEHPEARREQARRLTETGELAAAEKMLLALLAERPLDLEANLVYADLLEKDGRVGEAIVRLERMERVHPRACDVRLRRLELLIGEDRRDEASAALEALEKHCRDPELRSQAANLLEEGL
jgi:arylsulfatase A-like enzyme